MALIVAPRQRPGILPPRPESGLMQGLRSMLQDKLGRMSQNKEWQRTAEGLEASGIPREQAQGMSKMDKRLVLETMRQKGMSERTAAKKAEKAKVAQAENNVVSFLSKRRKIYQQIKSLGGDDAAREKVKMALIDEGVEQEMAELLTSSEMPDSLNQYFFKKARSNPKLVKGYARKYAYKF